MTTINIAKDEDFFENPWKYKLNGFRYVSGLLTIIIGVSYLVTDVIDTCRIKRILEEKGN